VNVDITPHVHPNHEVSMKVSIEVSQVTGQAAIGGIGGDWRNSAADHRIEQDRPRHSVARR